MAQRVLEAAQRIGNVITLQFMKELTDIHKQLLFLCQSERIDHDRTESYSHNEQHNGKQVER
ncbi:hypothetical protein D1872_207490 [compost metagenome]